MAKIELIATAAFGLEAVVAREIRNLGYEDLTVENGRVTAVADEAAIPRLNLWLRSADRVLVKLASFQALTFEELFEKTRALPWPEWIPENAEFPVEGKSVHSKLFSVPDCQAIVKKAVVEKMKERYRCNWFEEQGPRYKIEISLLKDMATLTIDTSGPGLHKRGYRKLTAKAPLRETLAASLVDLSRWRADRALIDPFCGSGTIPIEAALIGLNIAPGLGRSFAAEKWSRLPAKFWHLARQEAEDLKQRDVQLRIYGTDIDEEVLSLARYHARQAGVENQIHFQRLSYGETGSRFKYGYLISNPPYGERLGDREEAEDIYRGMGRAFRQLDTWSIYVLSANEEFEKFFGKKADKKRKLYNGRIKCFYYQFFGPKPPRAIIGGFNEPLPHGRQNRP